MDRGGARGLCADAQTCARPLPTIAVVMEPALWQLYESGSADDEVGVIIRMAAGMEPPPAARVVARFDDIFTARVRRGDIVTIRETPGVVSVKASTAVSAPFPLA